MSLNHLTNVQDPMARNFSIGAVKLDVSTNLTLKSATNETLLNGQSIIDYDLYFPPTQGLPNQILSSGDGMGKTEWVDSGDLPNIYLSTLAVERSKNIITPAGTPAKIFDGTEGIIGNRRITFGNTAVGYAIFPSTAGKYQITTNIGFTNTTAQALEQFNVKLSRSGVESVVCQTSGASPINSGNGYCNNCIVDLLANDLLWIEYLPLTTTSNITVKDYSFVITKLSN